MRKHLRWLAGLGVVALLSAGAIGQTIGTFNLTGNEIVRAALPGGGSDIAVPAYVLRGGSNFTLVATGTTVTTQAAATDSVLLATGAITTWNVNLPTVPFTGQKVIINCPGGTVTTLTIGATLPSGVALVGTNPTSCTSGGTIAQGSGWIYSTTANTWNRFL